MRKGRIPKGKHSKLLMGNIIPCTILHKYGENSYEISLPHSIAISPIFNIFDLVKYKCPTSAIDQILNKIIQYVEELNLNPPPPKAAKKVLDSRVYKKTRTTTYWEHILKWHDKEYAKATWIKEADFKKLGIDSIFLNPRME